ncbi:hypothetical protein [Virgibacillus kimchii]
MRKTIIGLIIMTSLMFFIFVFVKENSANTTNNDKEKMASDEEYHQIVESQILTEIGNTLYEEKGYSFGIEYDVLYDKRVDVTIKIANKKVTENIDKEIQEIAKQIIEKNEFDPQLFSITVKNYENY